MSPSVRTRGPLGILAGVAVIGLIAVAARSSGRAASSSGAPLASSAIVTGAPLLPPRPTRAEVAAPVALPSAPDAPSALDQTLAGEDEFAKIASIEEAVRDGDVASVPALARMDLARSPGAAPTIIHGLARLAVQGNGEHAPLAASTLARWLKEERVREGNDAAGNVPNLVESLGALGGREAVDAFVELLDGKGNDLAIETLTVQQLAGLGDASAKAAVRRFQARVRAEAPSEDAFERELQTEALAAATEALDRL